MASFTKFQPFVEKLAEKAFNLGSDSLKIALCASANAPVAANGVLADLTQISYTNLSSRDVTITSSSQSSGTYSLVLQDLTLTASGGAVAAFRYIVLYDDTAASDELIGFWDYGSSLTLADGESLTLDFASSTIQLS
jgi:hypothetical protein